MAGRALIGHTGFVGGTLLGQRKFDAVFNSRNIAEITGCQFDEIVCAGVSAVKWLANKDPEADWLGIKRLMDCLVQVSTPHFVLISTIDVYRETAGRTESDIPSTDGLHPYGRHRLVLEGFIAERFGSHTIVRLPALFGVGLKKNALFDLMTGNPTDRIVANAAFQWYPLRRLSLDLDIVLSAKLSLINFTAEPITMEAIRARFFPTAAIAEPAVCPQCYDLRSIHDTVLGGRSGYHLDARSVFAEMAAFLAEPLV